MSWNAKRFALVRRARGIRDRETDHHRKPTSLGGGEGDNISHLPRSKHMAWHVLFQNWDPIRIAQEINDKYLDPEYEFHVVHKRFKRGECE